MGKVDRVALHQPSSGPLAWPLQRTDCIEVSCIRQRSIPRQSRLVVLLWRGSRLSQHTYTACTQAGAGVPGRRRERCGVNGVYREGENGRYLDCGDGLDGTAANVHDFQSRVGSQAFRQRPQLIVPHPKLLHAGRRNEKVNTSAKRQFAPITQSAVPEQLQPLASVRRNRS